MGRTKQVLQSERTKVKLESEPLGPPCYVFAIATGPTDIFAGLVPGLCVLTWIILSMVLPVM